MNTHNNIDILDETLRIAFLESSKNNNTVMAQDIFTATITDSNAIQMKESRKLAMMENLKSVLLGVSFGELLKTNIQINSITEELLSEQSGLPIVIIKELEDDLVYTNNIPILLLKKLLNTLNISYDIAEKSIKRTFELLQLQLSASSQMKGVQPAFKKGNLSPRESFVRNAPKNNGKELFQNEEAMNRYLNRLGELMNE